MPSRLRRRLSRAPGPAPVPATRFYVGPATLHIVTERGSWAPRVDRVGLGWDPRTRRGVIEALLEDRDVRPTLPWWLRTSEPHTLALHGLRCDVDTPTVRRQGTRTVLRWATSEEAVGQVVAALAQWPSLFAPMLARPATDEERAVLKDFALSTEQGALAVWFG